MYVRINNIIIALILLCFTVSCSSNNKEELLPSNEEYRPFRASANLNQVYLSLKHNNGTTYNYDSLIANKGIKIYGELSKQELLVECTQRNGKEYLMFDADLPDTNKMPVKRVQDYDYAEGSSRAFIYLDDKKITLTFHFTYKSRDAILGTWGLNGISIDKIKLNNQSINYKEGEYAYCTIKKDSKGNFILEK